MKKSIIKVSFMLGLALVTAVSLNSCASDEEAEGEGTEQTDADSENEGEDDAEKCEDGKDSEHKCEDGKCQDGKCEGGETKEIKSQTKGSMDMTVDPQPEEKPTKKALRGDSKPKVTTDGDN